ncbi:hypothetical protein DFJ58DRAFT_848635 [Suillus subalutaceus]|uniref:uncharacterized protein n=1 Tax=Suillus subalutaceus TaxID=48586 RepID=UPI001B87C9CE|nr:uncharacterized protein DFJ58DRAFT_848635 [Suillus subalutaceus]KAG1829708.1 hypothetical protein DFJ58DRAFT_848635 [Suillus subalutaceus]
MEFYFCQISCPTPLPFGNPTVDNYNGSSRIKSTCWPLACFKAHGQGYLTRARVSEDHRPDPPPEPCEATVCESSSRVWQGLRKFTKGITKKISQRFKCSRNHISAIQNVDLQGASSNHNIEDMSHPHPFTDDNHPTTAENPSGSVNQGISGEPVSKVPDIPPGVEETPGSNSVHAALQGAHEASEHMKTLGGPALSETSAVNNAPVHIPPTPQNFRHYH